MAFGPVSRYCLGGAARADYARAWGTVARPSLNRSGHNLDACQSLDPIHDGWFTPWHTHVRLN